jgi:hypothetical protein
MATPEDPYKDLFQAAPDLEELSDTPRDPSSFRLYWVMAPLKIFKLGMPDIWSAIGEKDREDLWHQWNKEAIEYFQDVIGSDSVYCCFRTELGIMGHKIQKIKDSEYALYAAEEVPAGDALIFDYVAMMDTPLEADYDRPLGKRSTLKQCYLADTTREVAVSLNQVLESLLRGGELQVLPKSSSQSGH